MSENEKPLPKPPKTPFGKKRMSEEEQEGQAPLMADQMAMAAATGNLDEFMQQNIPDNEHARKLAMMMMGMTGLRPGGFPNAESETMQPPPASAQSEQTGEASPETEVPEDVRQAIMSGNMEELKGLLMREHARRTGATIIEEAPQVQEPGFNTAPSGIEKKVLDEMIRIASANSVTLDWLIMRALKVYIQGYQKTGSL